MGLCCKLVIKSNVNYSFFRNIFNGGIPLTNVTDKTVGISKYLHFGLYEKFWFKDNACLSPSEPGRGLGIIYRTVRLMCYHILTQKGQVIYRSTVQRVTDIELSTD